MQDSFTGHKIPEDILTKFTDKFWEIFANEHIARALRRF